MSSIKPIEVIYANRVVGRLARGMFIQPPFLN